LHHNRATLNGQRLNGYEHNGLGTSQGDTLTTSLEWRAAERLDIGWTGRFVRAIDALQTSVGTVHKPGYGVHDLQASWRPQAVSGLTLSLAVKNLFDKDYLDHGSNEDFQHIPDYEGIVGSREPGRELRLTVAMRF
jgi:hemoglobin/transferrin/lactoferrin receptor protein